MIGVWCNGNTADSGPAFPGSSPGTPTKSGCAFAHPLFCCILFPRHGPASEHGKPIKAFQATLLNAHSSTKHYPAGRIGAWDAQGLVGPDAREP